MNGLSALNTWSNSGFEYTDDRPTSFTFYPDTPVNQSITVYENQAFVSTVGTELTEVINRNQDILFEVNVAAAPSVTVTWSGLPAHLISNHTGTVYSVSGIQSVADWDLVKNPMISANGDNWSYDTTVTYWTSNTKVWTTTVNVTQLDQLTAASDYYYPDGASNLITGYPQVYALEIEDMEPPSYTCTVSSNDNSVFGNLSSSGGTWSANVLTITGNLSVINTELADITYLPADGIETSWLATYSLYNPNSGFTSTRIQNIRSQLAAYLDAPTSFYFDRNIPLQTVTGRPTVVDILSNTAANYTMAISSVESGAFGNLKTTFGSGTSVFAANVLTITGNKSTVNSHLATLTYSPALDYATDFHLRYQVNVPNGNVSVRIQDGHISANNTIISYMTTSRSFESNTQDQVLFPTSIPQITEVVAGTPTYAIYLTSTAGKFGLVSGGSDATASFSYSGTKTAVNAIFSQILFYPYKDVVGSQTFIYEQLRNGVSQTSQSVSLVGTARVTPIPGIGVNTITSSQVFTPTYSQSNYLLANVSIVGGGGGGGGSAYKVYSTGYVAEAGGGGGGAGGITNLTGNVITGNVSITIGIKGGGGVGTANSGWVTAVPGGTGTSTIFAAPNYTITCAGGTGGTGGQCGTTGGISKVISGTGGNRGTPNTATGVTGTTQTYNPPGNTSTASTKRLGGDGAVRGGGANKNGLGGAVSGQEALGDPLTSAGSGGIGGYGSSGTYGGSPTLISGGSGIDGKVVITFY